MTDRDCVANSTLTHELGHNMGNAHDRASGGTGVFAYSYGYRDTVGKFRTIMAYPCPTVSCPRVKYFSNPKIKINGRPAGIDHRVNPTNSADNAPLHERGPQDHCRMAHGDLDVCGHVSEWIERCAS
ncbi:MAG: hypothetical protein HC938_12475 [Nitrospira sp.]|nr:hypothetical protein [Nitrospira sp.]